MSLRQHYPQSPQPNYRTASRQSDRSVYSTTDTAVPRSQTGYDAKTDEWRKNQPDWHGQRQERFAPPPPPPPQAYGSGYGAYGTPARGYSGGGFDPKYDHINNAPPTRDVKKRGVYGTMCCGSPSGVCAWITGAVVVITILVVVLLEVFSPNTFHSSTNTSSHEVQSIRPGHTYTTTVTATPSTSISTESTVTTTTMTSVSLVVTTSVYTTNAFTTDSPEKGDA